MSRVQTQQNYEKCSNVFNNENAIILLSDNWPTGSGDGHRILSSDI